MSIGSMFGETNVKFEEWSNFLLESHDTECKRIPLLFFFINLNAINVFNRWTCLMPLNLSILKITGATHFVNSIMSVSYTFTDFFIVLNARKFFKTTSYLECLKKVKIDDLVHISNIAPHAFQKALFFLIMPRFLMAFCIFLIFFKKFFSKLFINYIYRT